MYIKIKIKKSLYTSEEKLNIVKIYQQQQQQQQHHTRKLKIIYRYSWRY